MPLTRRNFLIRGSLSLAAGALSSALLEAKTKENAPVDFKDWESVRRQFELAPGYIHLGLFFLASHPRCVRQAIEQYRAKLDANPLLTVEGAIFVQTDENIPLQVCRAIGNYIGGRRTGHRADAKHDDGFGSSLSWAAVARRRRDPDHDARSLCPPRINPARHRAVRSDLAENSAF